MTTPTAPCQQCCSPRCAGEGLTYNPTTRAYDVCVAPGGGIAVDANGCLVNTGGAGSTVVTGGTGTVVTPVAGGYQVTAPPSADAGNIITTGADGLAFISCAQLAATCGVGPITAGPGTDVTPQPGGGYQVSAAPSTDAGNLLTLGADGNLKITCTEVATCGGAGTPTTVTAGPGVDVTGSPAAGYTVSAPPSTDPDNRLTLGADGNLRVTCTDIAGCVSVTANPATPELAVTGAGTVANPYVVSEVPLVHPRARVRTTAPLLIPDEQPGGQAVAFGTEVYDRGDIWNAGAPTRLTVPAGWDGVYSMGANAQFQQVNDQEGFRALSIKLNGTTFLALIQARDVISLNDSTIININTDFELVAGDYIEVFVQSIQEPIGADTGANLTSVPEFSIAGWLTFLHR